VDSQSARECALSRATAFKNKKEKSSRKEWRNDIRQTLREKLLLYRPILENFSHLPAIKVFQFHVLEPSLPVEIGAMYSKQLGSKIFSIHLDLLSDYQWKSPHQITIGLVWQINGIVKELRQYHVSKTPRTLSLGLEITGLMEIANRETSHSPALSLAVPSVQLASV